MGNDHGHERGGDRQNPEQHGAMRGIDGLHAERHQEWKQNAYAERRDRQLRP